VRDSGLELSTRLHCTHVIVPLLRDPAEDETSRERGEQSVRPRQTDVERHFEPSAFRVREQPVRIVRVPHVRASVGLPTVRRSQAYKEPRGEREPHGSGLFHFDQGSLPTEHMACAQPDSAQFGVTIPKFRAPRIDIRKRGSKPLRYSEEHARRIHLWHKKAAARSSREASRCWLHLSPRTISPFQANHPIVRGGQSAGHLSPNLYERGAKSRQVPETPEVCKVDGRPSSCLITLALSSRLPFHDLNGSRHSP